jgi:hypothetical protein
MSFSAMRGRAELNALIKKTIKNRKKQIVLRQNNNWVSIKFVPFFNPGKTAPMLKIRLLLNSHKL